MAEIGDLVRYLREVTWRKGAGLRFEFDYLRKVKGGAFEKNESGQTYDLRQDIFANGLPEIPATFEEDGTTIKTPAVPAVPPPLNATQRQNLQAALEAVWTWIKANAADPRLNGPTFKAEATEEV